MILVETLNRTMKLAMDEGRVKSYQDAVALFGSFRLRLTVSPEFSSSAGGQAAVLTLLRAASKTFLGGVELIGPLEERCSMAWYSGMPLGDVAQACGVNVETDPNPLLPTIHVGFGAAQGGDFWLGVTVRPDGFVLDPESAATAEAGSSVEAGVAAAGAALNQAFQHLYRRSPLAGQREVAWRLPAVETAPRSESVWLVGLGHLGQAFLWTAALKGGHALPRTVKLTDDDVVSKSSLSTCLLVDAPDVGRKKVDAVGDRLEALQMQVQRDDTRVNLDVDPIDSERAVATPFIGAFAGAVLAHLATARKLPAQSWNFDVNSL